MIDRVDKQQITRVWTWSETMARVETVTGTEMNILAAKVPLEAYAKPSLFCLEISWFKREERKFPLLSIKLCE